MLQITQNREKTYWEKSKTEKVEKVASFLWETLTECQRNKIHIQNTKLYSKGEEFQSINMI